VLIAHKVIDALLGRGNRHKLIPIKGITEFQRQNVARLLEASQKFDFGDLMLEKNPNGVAGRWLLPALTHEECKFWEQGLIPLPFKACWYEFVINNSRSGLLVLQDMEGEKPGTYIHRIDYVLGEEVIFDGVLLGVEGATEEGLRCTLSGNTHAIESLRKTGELHDAVIMNAPLAIYLTMMLSSRSTEISVAPEQKFLNRKKIKKGLTPLPAHRIVHIVPNKYREAAESEARAERRMPRLHWRRSHLRHFDHQTGNSKYMPDLAYKGTQGWWVTVVPRMLVGRPELGEVTHEYKLEKL
jgi:hypothetical protein